MSTEPIDTTRCTSLCFILIHLLLLRRSLQLLLLSLSLSSKRASARYSLLLLLLCKCVEHNLHDGTRIQGLFNNSIVFAICVCVCLFCAIWFLCEFILYLYTSYREFFLPLCRLYVVSQLYVCLFRAVAECVQYVQHDQSFGVTTNFTFEMVNKVIPICPHDTELAQISNTCIFFPCSVFSLSLSLFSWLKFSFYTFRWLVLSWLDCTIMMAMMRELILFEFFFYSTAHTLFICSMFRICWWQFLHKVIT